MEAEYAGRVTKRSVEAKFELQNQRTKIVIRIDRLRNITDM